MAYEGYNVYLNYQASTSKEYFRTGLQAKINRDFSDTINVYDVQIKNRITGVFSDITVRIETYGQENSFFAHDDYKRIIFQDMDYEIYMGDIFEFDGYRWMVVQAKSKASATASCVVQRCNCVLKFTESTPLDENIIEIDCIAQNRLYDSENDNYTDLTRGTVQISMPYDTDSNKIRVSPKPTRFLLGVQDYRGYYKAWEVENIDGLQFLERNIYASTPSEYLGYMKMMLSETQINKVKDNHTVGVAWQNYF